MSTTMVTKVGTFSGMNSGIRVNGGEGEVT